jgi:hypothetical protein
MFTEMKGKLYEIASFNAGADEFILKTTSISTLTSIGMTGTERRSRLRSERLRPPLYHLGTVG